MSFSIGLDGLCDYLIRPNWHTTDRPCHRQTMPPTVHATDPGGV